jgi:hypothetical protein
LNGDGLCLNRTLWGQFLREISPIKKRPQNWCQHWHHNRNPVNRNDTQSRGAMVDLIYILNNIYISKYLLKEKICTGGDHKNRTFRFAARSLVQYSTVGIGLVESESCIRQKACYKGINAIARRKNWYSIVQYSTEWYPAIARREKLYLKLAKSGFVLQIELYQ